MNTKHKNSNQFGKADSQEDSWKLSKLVNVYILKHISYLEWLLLCVAIISPRKTVEKLLDKDEFNEIKNEPRSQYDKLKVILNSLGKHLMIKKKESREKIY